MSDPTIPPPTASELEEVERANASGKQPVVFVHGLWLLDSSWDRWATFFEDAGYAAVTPGWPDDPPSVEEAREDPERVRQQERRRHRGLPAADRRTARPQAGHHRPLVRWSARTDPRRSRPLGCHRRDRPGAEPGRTAVADRRPQVQLCRPVQPGQPAPGRGPHLRAVPLRVRQRRDRGGGQGALRDLPASPAPAYRSSRPRSPTSTRVRRLKVDNKTEDRGPMLVISGELDHQVPHAISHATYKRQAKNEGVTEFNEIDRSRSLPDHRRRLARGRAGVPRLRVALREVALRLVLEARLRRHVGGLGSSRPAWGTRGAGACRRCAARGTASPPISRLLSPVAARRTICRSWVVRVDQELAAGTPVVTPAARSSERAMLGPGRGASAVRRSSAQPAAAHGHRSAGAAGAATRRTRAGRWPARTARRRHPRPRPPSRTHGPAVRARDVRHGPGHGHRDPRAGVLTDVGRPPTRSAGPTWSAWPVRAAAAARSPTASRDVRQCSGVPSSRKSPRSCA